MATITAAMVKELRETTGSAMMECKKALSECNGDMEAAKEFLRKKGQLIASKKSARETKEGAVRILLSEDQKQATLVRIACETDFVAINDIFKGFMGKQVENAAKYGVDNFLEKNTEEGTIQEQFTAAIAEMGENIVFVEGEKWDAADNSLIGAYTHSNAKIGVMLEAKADKAVDQEKLKEMLKDVAMHIAASPVEAISEADLDPAILEKEKQFLTEKTKEEGKPENMIDKIVGGRIAKFKKEICLMDQPFVKNPDQTIKQLVADYSKSLGAEVSLTRYFKSSF